MHALAFGADLHRSSKKLDDLVLRHFGLFGCRYGDFFQRCAACVERLDRRVNLAPRFEDFLEGSVEFFAADFVLTSENLPDADACLKCAHRVATQSLITDGVERGHRVGESSDRAVVKVGKFSEEQVLIAEL